MSQLSDLERQPDESITDPWVSERVTLLAASGFTELTRTRRLWSRDLSLPPRP